MRKVGLLLSIVVLAAMILAACGGEETPTNLPSTNVPPVTIDVTPTSGAGSATPAESSTAVGASTETTTTGTPGTPGIPVTGAANSDRLSNELKFKVLDQSGKQVGKVSDMVLDLSKAKVLYVVVSAEKQIPVPWALLKVGTDSTSSNTNGQPNAFILQTDTETFKNAPALDLKNVPQLGEAPDSWDIGFRKYWAGGGATSDTNTPSPAGTAATDMTATATSTSNSAGTGSGNATSTPASAGTTQATGTGQGATAIQGVQLVSKVLGAKVTVGAQAFALGTATPGATDAGTGSMTSTPSTGTSLATATASTGTSLATSTPSSAGTSVATATSSTGTSQTTSTPSAGATAANLTATINDMIVNNNAGEILYIVIKASFDDGEHLIPVPLRLLQLNTSGSGSDTSQAGNNNQSFILNIDATTLQNSPSFQSDQFPDLTMPDWNSEFDSFWQKNGSGQATGAQATATP